MDKQQFMDHVREIFTTNTLNYIPEEKALDNALISAKIFEEPIMAVADATDDAFLSLKHEHAVGDHFTLPTQWLPEAKSVVSFFFPFTETIIKSNRENMDYPSRGWLNGRIEGQHFINDFSAKVVRLLTDNGYPSLSPSIDTRFFFNSDVDKNAINRLYTSNWSERHVAYACGLGTLSLSNGLITEKGVAGRLTSVITALHLPIDEKPYSQYDENCIMCGKCIQNCPVNAISFEYGHNHKLCSEFLNLVRSEQAPWYGCGKCQVSVPCEHRNPTRNTG